VPRRGHSLDHCLRRSRSTGDKKAIAGASRRVGASAPIPPRRLGPRSPRRAAPRPHAPRTSTAPTGSVSSAATRRAAPSPSHSSTARRTERCGQCTSACCERRIGDARRVRSPRRATLLDGPDPRLVVQQEVAVGDHAGRPAPLEAGLPLHFAPSWSKHLRHGASTAQGE
jgi:hypothetical protein